MSPSQFAYQADRHTPFDVVSETSCTLHCGDSNFCLDALVVKKLDVDVLAGNSFLTVNDIATRPAKRQVIVGGKDIVSYGAATTHNVSIRRAVRTAQSTTKTNSDYALGLSHCLVSCLQMTHGHWNHVWTAISLPSLTHLLHLVAFFGEVAHYSKPSPSLMPNVDGVLHDIAIWKYIIVTDLRQSFCQIPFKHGSMRFCGVVTPFKGVHVYTWSAMGMPGSETFLEELMLASSGSYSRSRGNCGTYRLLFQTIFWKNVHHLWS